MSEKRPDTNSQIEQILIQKAEKLPGKQMALG